MWFNEGFIQGCCIKIAHASNFANLVFITRYFLEFDTLKLHMNTPHNINMNNIHSLGLSDYQNDDYHAGIEIYVTLDYYILMLCCHGMWNT